MSTALTQRLKKAGYGKYIDRIEDMIRAGDLEQVIELLRALTGDGSLRGVEIPPSALNGREYSGLDLRAMSVQQGIGADHYLRNVSFTDCNLSFSSFQGTYYENDDRYGLMSVGSVLFDTCDLTGFEFESLQVRAIHIHNCYVRDARKPVEFVECCFAIQGYATLKVTGKALPLKLSDVTTVGTGKGLAVPLILATYELFKAQVGMISSNVDYGVYPVHR